MAWTDCSQSPQIFYEPVVPFEAKPLPFFMLIISGAIIQRAFFFNYFLLMPKK